MFRIVEQYAAGFDRQRTRARGVRGEERGEGDLAGLEVLRFGRKTLMASPRGLKASSTLVWKVWRPSKS